MQLNPVWTFYFELVSTLFRSGHSCTFLALAKHLLWLQIWCSHSGVAEVAILLGRDTVFLRKWFLMFCGIIVPSPEGSGSPRRTWGWWNRDPYNCQEHLAQWHGVISQKIWVFVVNFWCICISCSQILCLQIIKNPDERISEGNELSHVLPVSQNHQHLCTHTQPSIQQSCFCFQTFFKVCYVHKIKAEYRQMTFLRNWHQLVTVLLTVWVDVRLAF